MLVVQFQCKSCQQLFPSHEGAFFTVLVTRIHDLNCVTSSAGSKSLKERNCGSKEQCLVKKSRIDRYFSKWIL